MGFGTVEIKKERPPFSGGTKCPACTGTLVNVDGVSTSFTFCNSCGKLFCSNCGHSAFRSSTIGKYVCPQCAEAIFIFLPLLPDGEWVEITSREAQAAGLQNEHDYISFALQKIRS